MATFRVGQRVRKIRGPLHPEIFDPIHLGCETTGREGTVVAGPANWMGYEIWSVALDGCPALHVPDQWGSFPWFEPGQLAPLTDPKAEEFIANLKKLGKEPVPLTIKQLDEVRGA